MFLNQVFALKMCEDESKLFPSNFFALAILEHQIYVVVEQFGVENISLLSGRLVVKTKTTKIA